uniref:Uncharacterized protein n=2 Tax=Meloidogyne incognita TaxID=6306 RepID=A0A914LKL2_MELIC
MFEKYVHNQVLFALFLIQLLAAELSSFDNFQRSDVPAIEQRSISLDNPSLTRFGRKETGMMIQTALRNSGRGPFGALISRNYANLINMQRLQQRISDEQKLKNVLLRASARNGDDSPMSFKTPLIKPLLSRLQNLGKFQVTTENRNTGTFGKTTNEALSQQLTLKQILEQEKIILELLERDSQRKQLLRNNRLDLKDLQEKQQRILNLLIQQQQNNDDQIDSSIGTSAKSFYNPDEIPTADQLILSSAEDFGSKKPFQGGKIQNPISDQPSGRVSPREDQLQLLQISPYILGKNLLNNVGSTFRVLKVPGNVIKSLEDKDALMLIQQNGQQTAEIYGNEETDVEQKMNPQIRDLSNDNDSYEYTVGFEENDVLNSTTPSE